MNSRKSCRLSDTDRAERRQAIMNKRAATIQAHRNAGRNYVQYRTTRFAKHSSDRQRSRVARQTGYVAPTPEPVVTKTKRVRKPRATA